MSRTDQKNGSILLNKGINVSIPAEYIDDSSLRNSINFEISRNVIRKRDGSTELGDASTGSDTQIMCGRLFNREGTVYNVRVGLDKVDRYNTTTGAWVTISGADLTATSDDLHCTAVPLLSGKRILCITNGIDDIQKWTGTGSATTLGGTPPKCKFIKEYKTYLVCANITGGTDISQRVQWSDTADPETWAGGNAGAVDLVEDGEDITGLNVFGDYLAVHKKSSIYLGSLVSSTDIFRFVRKSTGAGAIANNSIQNLPTGHQIFLSSDGIRLFNGVTASLIPSPINDEVRDELNPKYAYAAWSVLVKEKDEVWIGIPVGSQTVGDTVYKFNYVNGTLYKDERENASAAWLASSSATKSWDDFTSTWDEETNRWNERSLAEESEQINIGYTDGSVLIVDPTTNNDDSNAISAYFVTKDFQDSQQVISRWKSMELWAKGGSVEVQYSTDGGNTWNSISNSPLTLDSEYPSYDSPDMLYFDTVSSKIRFKFINTNVDEALTIKQFIINYSPREYRR